MMFSLMWLYIYSADVTSVTQCYMEFYISISTFLHVGIIIFLHAISKKFRIVTIKTFEDTKV